MFMITNFMIIDPKMKPKLRTNPCTWYSGFSHRTTVEHLETPTFPYFIGDVVGKENPRDVVTNIGREKRLVVVLQDTELVLMSITFLEMN
ncbi:hypothetical protein PIB30_091533 [Stylosanthes scabra]|uniref:Uncharacterized protein n=1 Tax=Stylosanthes scabra TaxID=79078 RepID=A0ABU6WY48_9FABA|nr:hypothetical protein [Stylosanthes scabra]